MEFAIFRLFRTHSHSSSSYIPFFASLLWCVLTSYIRPMWNLCAAHFGAIQTCAREYFFCHRVSNERIFVPLEKAIIGVYFLFFFGWRCKWWREKPWKIGQSESGEKSFVALQRPHDLHFTDKNSFFLFFFFYAVKEVWNFSLLNSCCLYTHTHTIYAPNIKTNVYWW